MKFDERALKELVDRSIPTPSDHEMESRCDRVLQNLQSGNLATSERTRRRLSMQPVGDAERETEALPAEYGARRPAWKWRLGFAGAVAAVVLAVVFMPRGIDARAVVEEADGGLYQASGRVLQAGEKIEIGSVVRANGSGAMLKLADGSHVEMRGNSKLSLERADDGVRIQLNDGDVIVSAAKQHGHLYVQTKDVNVSVVGTVFLVKTEASGSRVAVIEGEVRVQQGEMEKRLLSGEQVQTNPSMESLPVSEQIAWSRSAQPPIAPQVQRPPAPVPPARAAFDVVSIRPAAAAAAGGRGGGAPGGRGQAQNACPNAGTVLDPAHIRAPRITAFRLITWAYETKACALQLGLITGQPDWVTSDLYEFQATIPAGTPAYGFGQLQNGEAPILQEMLQTMLADRFRLKFHREKKEVAAFDLVVAKPGKMTPSKDQAPPSTIFIGGSDVAAPAGGLVAGPDGCRPLRAGMLWSGPELVCGAYVKVSFLAQVFASSVGRPVVDKTGLKGFFDIKVSVTPAGVFAPRRGEIPAELPTPPVVGPGITTTQSEILEGLGLKLEPSRTTIEVIVIDSIEKPSEN